MWHERHSLSVCIWLQDWAHLSLESNVRVLPHPRRSLNNYFSIFVNFFPRTAHQFFCHHNSPSNLAKSWYPHRDCKMATSLVHMLKIKTGHYFWCFFRKCSNTMKPRQSGRKMTSFRGAMGRHGQTGSWRGQWTGWIGFAPVQISGCGLDGALSWCGQGEGQIFLVSSWAARAVVAAPSFQTCFACVHMYILYACVYICVCVYVCGHDTCIYMHVCMYLYIYAFIHVCMCMCMHICA